MNLNLNLNLNESRPILCLFLYKAQSKIKTPKNCKHMQLKNINQQRTIILIRYFVHSFNIWMFLYICRRFGSLI